MAAAVHLRGSRAQHGADVVRWRFDSGVRAAPSYPTGEDRRHAIARIRRSQVSHQANSRLAGRARRVRGWLAVHRRRASPRTVSARLARHCRLGRGGLDARRGRVFRARRQPRPQYGQQTIRTRSSVRDSGLGHGADLAYSRTESLLTRFHPITKLSRAQYPTHIHIKGWLNRRG